jgi:hypothetical protein
MRPFVSAIAIEIRAAMIRAPGMVMQYAGRRPAGPASTMRSETCRAHGLLPRLQSAAFRVFRTSEVRHRCRCRISPRSTRVNAQENTMTRDRDTQAQELTPEQLESVTGGSLLASGLKLMGEILSNVSKTRSEISMTFARNTRA